MASKRETKTTPYMPPVILRLDKAGGGPSTPASSLLNRMGKRKVDDEVIAVVAWATSYFKPTPTVSSLWDMGARLPRRGLSRENLMEAIQKELLDDLGLEWVENPMGGRTLRPRAEFRDQPRKESLPDLARKHGGWEEGHRWYFPSTQSLGQFAVAARGTTSDSNLERILSNVTIKTGGKKA